MPHLAAVLTPPVLLTGAEICLRLKVSPRHLARLVNDEKFPRPLKIGRCCRWLESDIEQFVERLGGYPEEQRR